MSRKKTNKQTNKRKFTFCAIFITYSIKVCQHYLENKCGQLIIMPWFGYEDNYIIMLASKQGLCLLKSFNNTLLIIFAITPMVINISAIYQVFFLCKYFRFFWYIHVVDIISYYFVYNYKYKNTLKCHSYKFLNITCACSLALNLTVVCHSPFTFYTKDTGLTFS